MDNYCFALWLQRGAHKTKTKQPGPSVGMDAVERPMLHSRGEGFSSTVGKDLVVLEYLSVAY